MNKEFVFLNVKPYLDLVSREAWCLDSVQQPESAPYYYLFMKKPLTDAGIDHSIKMFDDIDKSKPWFIPFTVTQGSWDWTEHDLWDTLPDILLNELIHGNAYLLMNNENEYDTRYVFSVFYKMYRKNSIVPIHKLVLLTPASSGQSIYEIYVKENNIPEEMKVKVLYSPHIDFTFNNGILIRTDAMVETTNKSKKFICLNRAFRWHRPCLVALLASDGLLEKGYVSLGKSQREDREVELLGSWKTFLNKSFSVLPEVCSPKRFALARKLFKGAELIADRMPLTVDKDEFLTNYADFNYTPTEYIQDSYFSVVTSTHFFKWQEESSGWNEKEWKPVLARHPFIIINRPHTLKYMRRLGILTFSKWIDESYDDIEDDWDRLEAIVKEIKRLSEIDNKTWDKMRQEMMHILEYNRNIIINKRWENIFYASDLKELLKYI